MLHLSMNQVGFDARALGFPSVLGCNAIVLQTRQGLIGLHNYGGDSPDQFAPRAAAFKAFAQRCNIVHSAHGCNLYSTINVRHSNRSKDGLDKKIWKDELVAFAKALNFAGPIVLVALRQHVGGLQDSVYIQYELNGLGEECKIKYKKWAKMEPFKDSMVGTPNVPEFELKRNVEPIYKKRWFKAPKIVGAVTTYELAPPNSDVFEAIRTKEGGSLHKVDNINADILSGR